MTSIVRILVTSIIFFVGCGSPEVATVACVDYANQIVVIANGKKLHVTSIVPRQKNTFTIENMPFPGRVMRISKIPGSVSSYLLLIFNRETAANGETTFKSTLGALHLDLKRKSISGFQSLENDVWDFCVWSDSHTVKVKTVRNREAPEDCVEERVVEKCAIAIKDSNNIVFQDTVVCPETFCNAPLRVCFSSRGLPVILDERAELFGIINISDKLNVVANNVDHPNDVGTHPDIRIYMGSANVDLSPDEGLIAMQIRVGSELRSGVWSLVNKKLLYERFTPLPSSLEETQVQCSCRYVDRKRFAFAHGKTLLLYDVEKNEESVIKSDGWHTNGYLQILGSDNRNGQVFLDCMILPFDQNSIKSVLIP